MTTRVIDCETLPGFEGFREGPAHSRDELNVNKVKPDPDYTTMNRTWDILLQYQSSELVKRRFKERHARTLSTTNAVSITSAVTQAREYFSSASTAAMAVRPLLLYYGILAVTRALILFSSRKKSEAALRPAHGLEINHWQQTLVTGWANVADLRITVRRGTFTELLETTNNKAYFRNNSSAVNWQITYDVPPVGTEFTFGGLCQCVPDTKLEFEAWKNAQFAYAHLNTFDPASTADLFEAGLGHHQQLDEVFPELLCAPRTIINDGSNTTVRGSKNFRPYFVQHFGGRSGIGAFGIGDVCIVPVLPGRQYLSTLGLFFGISFTLGMLVRYFPSIWVSLGQGRGDAVSPIVHQLVDFIESKYPQLVVDYLLGPYGFDASPGETTET